MGAAIAKKKKETIRIKNTTIAGATIITAAVLAVTANTKIQSM